MKEMKRKQYKFSPQFWWLKPGVAKGFAIVRLGFTVIDDEHWRVMESLDLQLEKLSSVIYSIKEMQHLIHLRECFVYSEIFWVVLSIGCQDNFQPSLGYNPRIMATSRRDPLFYLEKCKVHQLKASVKSINWDKDIWLFGVYWGLALLLVKQLLTDVAKEDI